MFDAVRPDAVAVSASAQYRQIAFDYFSELAASGGPPWQRAGWSSPETQRQRWKVFADAVPFRRSSVLDVGAGAGGFATFLHRVGAAPASYIGVEPVAENCRQLASEPGVDAVICGTIDAVMPSPCADYVTASGLFNFEHPAWIEHFVVEVCEFLTRARRAVLVNAIVPDSLWEAAIAQLDQGGVAALDITNGDHRERACVLSPTLHAAHLAEPAASAEKPSR